MILFLLSAGRMFNVFNKSRNLYCHDGNNNDGGGDGGGEKEWNGMRKHGE